MPRHVHEAADARGEGKSSKAHIQKKAKREGAALYTSVHLPPNAACATPLYITSGAHTITPMEATEKEIASTKKNKI
jgi:hypothetical protein